MDFLGDSDRDFAPKNTEDDSESVRRLVDDQGAAVVWGKTRNSVRNLVGAEDFAALLDELKRKPPPPPNQEPLFEEG